MATEFYEREQERCCSVPAGALYGGQRVSQWHKLCWSRAGVTLARTTGQPRQSRSFPGYCTSRFDYMTHISEGELFLIPLKLRCSVRLYCSVWSFLQSFAVIRSVSACKLTCQLALMPERGPPCAVRFCVLAGILQCKGNN